MWRLRPGSCKQQEPAGVRGPGVTAFLARQRGAVLPAEEETPVNGPPHQARGPWPCPPGGGCKCVAYKGSEGKLEPWGGAWEDPRGSRNVHTECGVKLGLSALLCSQSKEAAPRGTWLPTRSASLPGHQRRVRGLISFARWPLSPGLACACLPGPPGSAHTPHSLPVPRRSPQVLNTCPPPDRDNQGCQGCGQGRRSIRTGL